MARAAPRLTSPTCTPGARSSLPGAGWIGLDPHLRPLCRRRPFAAGLHADPPSSAAPISGAVDECEVEFGHEMVVTRVWEAPRVTKPLQREPVAQVLQLGERSTPS